MKSSFRQYLACFLGILLLLPSFVFAEQAVISKEQNAWLDNNKRTVLVHPQEFYPPFVFASSGSKREIKGFSVEYFNLIAKKLDIKVSFSEPAPLDQILSGARERNEGVILSLTPTEEREEYLYFTDSYYSTPAVIVARKDFSQNKKVITLSDFENKKIAVGSFYAVHSYIDVNYSKIKPILVPDDQIGLQKLLLGEVDALVMDFASFSYYTANDVLSYVKIIGRTGFDYKHSIAVPKSSPELVLILNEGLKSVSEAERQVLINKWMGSDTVPLISSASDVAPSNPSTLNAWLLFVGFIILIIATIIIVGLLQKRRGHVLKHKFMKKHVIAGEVQEELEELKIAREALKEDLEEISELERDIEEKIEKIDK
ncbi:MAG: hypothetical protein QG674_19 [Patescibacteria group bacterium]|nr:hypothetical protein [Patescibacteria group bacterium]